MTKIQNFVKVAAATATVLALSPLSVFATSTDTINLKVTNSDFSAITNLKPSGFVTAGINLILIASAIIAFFFLLIGGVQWIFAGGDKEGTEKARKRITASLVGLAIVFSAYALVFIIQALFGVNILSFDLKQIGNY
ncbi:MAG: hypothetical protein AAB550_00030 [Patescibacteria group bacterium]